MAVMQACLQILTHCSVALMADREFIGTTWIWFLFTSLIEFFIRLGSNTRGQKDHQNRYATQ